MCLFRKKKIQEEVFTGNKYEMNQFVHFRYRDTLTPGYIYKIKKMNDKFYYDIQIGGECPAIIENVEEEKIVIIKR